ncbi:hypothetical protein [Haloarchaeobius iranensis]|uniref:Uncharacterized protein n=1 Tax=Haloarchaeobius iranensis TaxID=996166 RepID=A0A1G9YZ16_9EURY|nr:hypothetical protein [Haloarchaeobius iranensis]SDN14368.1 hypothetical protein SAMN05192554_1175 [Haloarchaeobius iranensis]
MVPETVDRRRSRTAVVIAVVLTGIVYLEFWGGTVPPLPGAGTVALAVGVGVAAAVLQLAFEDVLEPPTVLDNTLAFLVLLGVALVVGLLLFPQGLPVAVELGMLAWFWATAVGRLVLFYGKRD